MNNASISSKSSRKGGNAKRVSVTNRAALQRALDTRKARKRTAPKAPQLEPIAHLRSRELAAYGAGDSSSNLNGERVVAEPGIPKAGTSRAHYWRIGTDELNKLLKSVDRAKLQGFERVMFNHLQLEVQPGLSEYTNGYHAIGFVSDPRKLIPPVNPDSTEADNNKYLPSTIPGLQVLDHYQLRRINKPLKIDVDASFLHKAARYAPYNVEGDGETERPVEFVSPGWIVYIMTDASQSSGDVPDIKQNVSCKYRLRGLEAAPLVQSHDKVAYTAPSSAGVLTPFVRFFTAHIARQIAPAQRAAAGYVGAQIEADMALMEDVEKLYHAAHKNDWDLWSWSTFANVIGGLASIASVAGSFQSIYRAKFTSTLGAGRHRDLTSPAAYKSLNFSKILRYENLQYSEGTGVTGSLMSFASTIFCPTKEGAIWPQDYAQAWTSSTQISKAANAPILPTGTIGAPAAVSQVFYPPNASNIAQTTVTWNYGSRGVQSVFNGPTMADTLVVRPSLAANDPTISNAWAGSFPVGTVSNAYGNFISATLFKFGIREGDIRVTYVQVENYTDGVDPLPTAVPEDFNIFSFDEEDLGSNDYKRYTVIEDAFS